MRPKPKPKSAAARPGYVRPKWRMRGSAVFLDWWASKKENRLIAFEDAKNQDTKFKEWFRNASQTSRAFNEAMSQIKHSPGGEGWRGNYERA